MIERWTIDTIADEIESQFKGADPQKKLLRRFYNEGKHHGRKGMSPEPMANFLANAVEVATSKIAQDFLKAEQQLAAARASMQARKTMIEEDLGEHDGPPDGGSTVGAGGLGGGAGLGAHIGGPDLKGSFARLQAKRAAQVAATDAAKRRGERDQMEQELDGIDQQLALADQQLDDLPDEYRQMVESCHETGELMWTRYVLGYNLGDSKRGVSDNDNGADLDIEFEYPDVLDPDLDDPSPRDNGEKPDKSLEEDQTWD